MKFTTEKNEIVEALQMGASIAERRQTIPILANLRIIAKEGKVEITATDLEIQIKTITEVTQVIDPCRFRHYFCLRLSRVRD